MTGEFDILISVYLDGEVTAEERSFVEQLLLDSAEARQFFEQLRRQRQLLRGLAQRPSHDFAPRVLQEIHRLGLDAELLSAYLDDEVTPAERLEAETQLAASIERQQLLVQLRSQRAALQELPRRSLPADFSHRVLAALDHRYDDLLSGVLDEQLTVEEQTHVAKRLAESTVERELLESLRGQRETLRQLPRHSLGPDFSARVLAAIDRERVAPQRSDSILSPEPTYTMTPLLTTPCAKPWWRSWTGVSGLAGALAAGLLLVLMVARQPQSTGPIVPATTMASAMTDEELDSAADLLLAQAEVAPTLIMIYDALTTPAGRKNRTIEKWLAQAGLPIEKSITVNARLEKELLDARFIGADRIARLAPDQAPQDDVEMVLLRGTLGQIDAFFREYQSRRGRENLDVSLSMDVAAGTQELRTLMKLTAASSGNSFAQLQSQPRAIQIPGAIQIRFGGSLHSTSLRRFAAIRAPLPEIKLVTPSSPTLPDVSPMPAPSKELPAKPAAATLAVQKQDPNSREAPGFALLILRHLRTEPAASEPSR